MGLRAAHGLAADTDASRLLAGEIVYPLYGDGSRKALIGNGDGTANEIAFKAALDTLQSAVNKVLASGSPVLGSLAPWPLDASTVPSNCLLAAGGTVSRAAWPELFALYGTKFGAGDGSTTFGLPDWRGVIPVGYKSGDNTFGALGAVVGSKNHTHALTNAGAAVSADGDALRVHRNAFNEFVFKADVKAPGAAFQTAADDTGWTAQLMGNTDAASSVQPSVVTNWIIIAKTSNAADAIQLAVTQHDTGMTAHASIRDVPGGIAGQDKTQSALLNIKRAISRSVTNTAAVSAAGCDDAGARQIQVADGTQADMSFPGETDMQIIPSSSGVKSGTITSAQLTVSSGSVASVGHKYFVRALSKSAFAIDLRYHLSSYGFIATLAASPSAYVSSYAIYTVPTVYNDNFYLQTSAAVTGAYDVKLMVVDMGADASNPLYSLTADQMSAKFPTYFEGVQNVVNLSVTSRSKNLLAVPVGTVTVNGVTAMVGADGTVTLNGTVTAAGSPIRLYPTLGSSWISNTAAVPTILGRKYTLGSTYISGSASTTVNLHIHRATAYDEWFTKNLSSSASDAVTATAAVGDAIGAVYIYLSTGMTFSNLRIKLQVECADTATAWAQHQESTLTIPGSFGAGDSFTRRNGVSLKNGASVATTGDYVVYPGGSVSLSSDTGVVPVVTSTYLADVLGMLANLQG